MTRTGGNLASVNPSEHSDAHMHQAKGLPAQAFHGRSHWQVRGRRLASQEGRKQILGERVDRCIDAVRAFTTECLRDLGFNVIEAADASEALKILDRNSRIDLLFTDIGLPGLNGRELAAAVHRRYHRFAYCSQAATQMPGTTTSNALADILLLSKPFTRAQLYQRISEVLRRQ
jgi:CheY-like chemotaxis protein